MDYEKTLAGLCALPGPSGFEGQAAGRLWSCSAPWWTRHFWTVWAAWWGCWRCGREGAKKVLLDAHLDEIGFLITRA